MNFNAWVRYRNMMFKNNSTPHVGLCINVHLNAHLFGMVFDNGTKSNWSHRQDPKSENVDFIEDTFHEFSKYITAQKH